ncbi:uncharacterized protein LOC129593243 [Paramacrobiotus metropolitanus]|uniref:uncharacterized protein LOC129593243 n=1 Tax=Paramacrobiotus metropolitanus TaxID=2943436 RepID=UPI002445D11F|nr:uncharacterized protein LOC129593243 [Paramacrobiotus metropolitanus]
MSDRTEETETRAGHPPATKVGGMRITQRSRSPGAEGAAASSSENPQIPPQDKEGGDTQVHGVGGLQSQPKDLLVKGTSGIPVTAKDLGMHLEGVRHTHDKGFDKNQQNSTNFTPQQHATMTRHGQHINEPRSHGTNH